MTKYRAAVIGCGKIGADVERYNPKIQPWAHASIYLHDERTELVGLADMDASKKDRLAEDFPGVPFYQDIKRMLEEVKPEIVSVATNADSHAAIVELVASYPVKAILCEKPIASNSEEGRMMVELCREKNILLLVNHMRRFDTEIRAAKSRVQALGPVMQANVYYYRGMRNNGTHFVDLLRYFLGDVTKVVGIENPATSGAYVDLPGEKDVDAMLVFASGARATLQSFDNTAYSNSDMNFICKNGRVGIRHFGFRIEEVGLKPCSIFVGHNELDDRNPKVWGEARSLMAPAVAHIVDCIEGRDRSLSSGEDGLATLKVVDAIMESASRGGELINLA